jgi:predicted nucleotidyltransferase
MQTIEEKILSRFYGRGRGHVATQKFFLDLGSRDAVDQALSRLAKSGKLRRIARGLYEYPRTHPILGELSPDFEKVAAAIAGRDGIRLQPTGAYAANLLHLSEQLPVKIVYLTDGASRKVEVGQQTIELRKASPKRMQLHDRISGLVFEALREIGKDQIKDDHIQSLQQTLAPKEKATVRHDLREAPAWMHPHIREFTQSVDQENSTKTDQAENAAASCPAFDNTVEKSIADACREFSVSQLYLFGSLARGEAHEESDVDLLVEFKRDGVAGAFDQFMGFKERMESILGRPVDIITAKRFRNPYFQQAVEAEKQLIYAA